jgi:hypothetical protein
MQNVSGLNRQAKQTDIMNDPKNRLVACYLSLIDHFRPSYLLIEQVSPWQPSFCSHLYDSCYCRSSISCHPTAKGSCRLIGTAQACKRRHDNGTSSRLC